MRPLRQRGGLPIPVRLLVLGILLLLPPASDRGTPKTTTARPIYVLEPVSKMKRDDSCDFWRTTLDALHDLHANLDLDGLTADCAASYRGFKMTKCPDDRSRPCESIHVTSDEVQPRTLEVTVSNDVFNVRVLGHGRILAENEKLRCDWAKNEKRDTCEQFVSHKIASLLKTHNDLFHPAEPVRPPASGEGR